MRKKKPPEFFRLVSLADVMEEHATHGQDWTILDTLQEARGAGVPVYRVGFRDGDTLHLLDQAFRTIPEMLEALRSYDQVLAAPDHFLVHITLEAAHGTTH